jgi:hypothetical protein
MMLRVTRSLISARNAYTKDPLRVVSVTRSRTLVSDQPYIEPHTSHQNACREFFKNNLSAIVVGWLVQPYDPKDGCTCILHHWWNQDHHGEYFDTTFSGNSKDEYVIEPTMTLLFTPRENYLERPQCSSLIHRDDKFVAFHEAQDGAIKFRELKSLSLREIRIKERDLV